MSGRIAVVTGASSGVGEAIAAELDHRGYAVSGLSRRQGCDVTSEREVAGAFGRIGHLDRLVLCAGHGVFGAVERMAAEDLRAMLEVHAVGGLLCLQAALPKMADGARVVVIGSTATRWTFAGTAGYAAAKAAQDALFRVAGEELRERRIGVTRVVLGPVDTPIWDMRPGFERAKMLGTREAATAILDAADHGVEELLLRPAGGNL